MIFLRKKLKEIISFFIVFEMKQTIDNPAKNRFKSFNYRKRFHLGSLNMLGSYKDISKTHALLSKVL